MQKRIFILWLIWTLLGAGLIYGVAASDSKNTMISIIAMVLSVSPLLGFMLALGSPKASAQFNNWLQTDKNSIFYVSGGMALLFALPGLLTITFNPYTTAIFAAMVLAVLHSLKKLESETFALTWTDVILWIALWIPFDLRWSMELHPMLDYTWWSIAISVIAVIGWRGYRNADIGINLVPKIKDIFVALLALLMIMAVVVPPGILTGFLKFQIPETFPVAKLTAHFIGLFLTVALPEELFFRGLLLRGLEKVSSKKWMPMVVSSLAFGLMHWNNISGLTMQITYVSLASIAGFGYAWAYKKSGNNLLAAILTHTLVDWVWKLILAS
jgi:membrane protease YdiL (CAAX protease family)